MLSWYGVQEYLHLKQNPMTQMDVIKMFPLILTLACIAAVHGQEGWFWHMTDPHYDFSYAGRDLSCSDNVKHHGEFGDYMCDSPWSLIKSSLDYMKSTKPDVDFILWTGDNALHTTNDNLSTDIVDGILGNITSLINEAFPSIPVYPTFGNHDYFPKNQFPPHGNGLYNRTFDRWSHWIGDITSQEYNFKKGGYYTVMTKHGLRIVALNTNMYLTYDKESENIDDPADQFMWLEGVLHGAVTGQEKVLITGHVPSGIGIPRQKPWIFDRFNNRINDIIRRYSDVIVGTHFGHAHLDHFRVFYKEGFPVVSQFCSPSVTPWTYKIKSSGKFGPAHNPAVRLVKYDRQTGKNLDILQYYMDLPNSNLQNRPVWSLGYNFTRDYKIPDITPTSMHKLIQRMKTENSSEFSYFMKWHVVNVTEARQIPCNRECKTFMLCVLEYVEQTSFDACMMPGLGSSDVAKLDVRLLAFVYVLTILYSAI